MATPPCRRAGEGRTGEQGDCTPYTHRFCTQAALRAGVFIPGKPGRMRYQAKQWDTTQEEMREI